MAAENAMAFGVNEALKRAFSTDPHTSAIDSRPDLAKPFAMGMITGCCSALVLLPSEVVKAKTQVVVGGGTSSGQIIKQMIKANGYRSLFAGLDAQLARDSLFYAVFFGGYELFCYSFRTHVPSMPNDLNYFLSGGFAGMLGWLVAMPFDVPIKTAPAATSLIYLISGFCWLHVKSSVFSMALLNISAINTKAIQIIIIAHC